MKHARSAKSMARDVSLCWTVTSAKHKSDLSPKWPTSRPSSGFAICSILECQRAMTVSKSGIIH